MYIICILQRIDLYIYKNQINKNTSCIYNVTSITINQIINLDLNE